ncbi:MAG TPA: hypothetical protein PLI77_08545 [Bacteroidales bacterium]|nr:hypothetical protein [Bacteroidales bacterium]HRW35504.1 hypothetical protein [Thermotogota bacterium]
MNKIGKSRMEKALLESLEFYRVLYFDELLRQEGFDSNQPVLEKLKSIPSFDEETYLKRYDEDFSVYFANESIRREFIEKKYARDVAEVEEANRRIVTRNEKRMEEWRKKLSKKSFGEINQVEKLYRQYANKEAEGVVWFFLKVIRNIPHDFFYGNDFQCTYERKYQTLKIHFVFPDKLSVFISQDDDQLINSIHDPSFKRYYYGILLLIIRNLFNAIYKNDLENALEYVYLQGRFSEIDDSRSETVADETVSITSHMDIDSLKKIHGQQPEELFKDKLSTFEIPPEDVVAVPKEPNIKDMEEKVESPIEDENEAETLYEAFEEKVMKGLDLLSEIKAIILREDYHTKTSESFEYAEETAKIVDNANPSKESDQTLSEYTGREEKDYDEFFQRVNTLSESLMCIFLKILRMEPAEKHPLDSLEASKLNMLNLVNKLVYQGRPLIRLSGYEWDEFSWGEEYPKELIEQLRKRYLAFEKRS